MEEEEEFEEVDEALCMENRLDWELDGVNTGRETGEERVSEVRSVRVGVLP